MEILTHPEVSFKYIVQEFSKVVKPIKSSFS